jgi:uncharacterized protein (DUF4415 family)
MSENKHGTDPDWVDPDDAPELDDHFFDNAEVRDGAKLLRAATDTMARRGRPPLEASSRRRPVSIRLSPRVLDYFRQTGPGWQSRINEILEHHVEGGVNRSR